MSTLRLEPARVGTPGSARRPGPLVRVRRPARALRALAHGHRPADGVHEQRHATRCSRARCSRAASSGWRSPSSCSSSRRPLDYHWLRTFAWPIYLVAIGLLVVTLVIGTGTGGVSRWVSILGLQFQFSEVAKILLAVVLAHYLASARGSIASLLDDRRRRPHRAAAARARAHPARPRARRSCSAPSSSGRCSCRVRACAG